MNERSRRPQTWAVKADPDTFRGILDGWKRYELMKMERDYRPGDLLIIQESAGEYLGDIITATITDVQTADAVPGLEGGYMLLTFKPRQYYKGFTLRGFTEERTTER